MAAFDGTMDGLSQLILDLDPARTTWAKFAARARGQIEELHRQMQRMRDELAARVATEGDASAAGRLDAALETAGATLAELRQAVGEKTDPTRWRQLYARLASSYEEMRRLVDALPQPVSAGSTPRISRTNLSRAAFHVGSGLFAALLYHFMLSRPQAILLMAVLTTTFLSVEYARRRSSAFNDFLMGSHLIRVIARPHEYFRVNSATYFGIGLLLAAIFAPKPAVELGCVVLAVADPIASTLGRRFGKKKLYRDKSWVGTSAFFGAGLLAGLAYLRVLHPELGQPLAVAALAAAAGAAAELLTTRLDDNLTVPLTTALALSLLI